MGKGEVMLLRRKSYPPFHNFGSDEFYGSKIVNYLVGLFYRPKQSAPLGCVLIPGLRCAPDKAPSLGSRIYVQSSEELRSRIC